MDVAFASSPICPSTVVLYCVDQQHQHLEQGSAGLLRLESRKAAG